ncbi:hypothetical protein ANANG_G00267400 [Anguilla anguilla]|uniref:BTB domain-containing protein n=1 Tax=Anguilla anguilla TaxID=7936 RepID=A0A9D3LUG5_ANGAN|nr:hypothetical protein ANANG_G00267400 [Anguilla anguilla]
MESETNSFRVEFPDFSCSILQKLNQQRQLGQLCDITVVIQGRHYRAHRAVLAASSPYFCDQVLLKNSMRVVLPDVMHHCVFEGLLQSCYTGSLQLPAGEVVGYLTAASFLQMWHVVDKCTELLGGQRSCSGSDRDRLSPGDGNDDDSASEGLEAEPHGEFLPTPETAGETDRPTENGSPATSSEQGAGRTAKGRGRGGVPVRPACLHPAQHHVPPQVDPGEGGAAGAGGLPGLLRGGGP